MNIDIWMIVAFLLTLLVFSYLLGDNLLFRLTAYLFVGVSAGVLAVMVIDQVLVPRLFNVFLSGNLKEILLVLPALVLGLLLFFKLSPRLSWIGNLSMAYLVGAGAAVIIGGASPRHPFRPNRRDIPACQWCTPRNPHLGENIRRDFAGGGYRYHPGLFQLRCGQSHRGSAAPGLTGWWVISHRAILPGHHPGSFVRRGFCRRPDCPC